MFDSTVCMQRDPETQDLYDELEAAIAEVRATTVDAALGDWTVDAIFEALVERGEDEDDVLERVSDTVCAVRYGWRRKYVYVDPYTAVYSDDEADQITGGYNQLEDPEVLGFRPGPSEGRLASFF